MSNNNIINHKVLSLMRISGTVTRYISIIIVTLLSIRNRLLQRVSTKYLRSVKYAHFEYEGTHKFQTNSTYTSTYHINRVDRWYQSHVMKSDWNHYQFSVFITCRNLVFHSDVVIAPCSRLVGFVFVRVRSSLS